ncbi:2,4-dienoyl-CoA reductase, mitochondrial [Strongyloides ratti]|uniref:2,4-dienoyl-CoA reductase, mitochondrial n=1 Tax=Strongyloides ratti TaxID=34506 RepID=A0A090KXV5_STRRB|nr:2,4-dienoyl-CoA reductase, mitochondrial [Strongyloides ratti]CEF62231.1 2,4-dienoyl-CoA reductase, mitochondrial [Strongyloides ratti]
MACTNPTKFFPIFKGLALTENAFKGKVALVTGGGTGMGKAIAKTISMLGGDVAIASRKINVLQEAAKEIEKESGRFVLPIETDVRDNEKVKNCIDMIENKFGKTPNVVINNAAGNFVSPFERMSENAFKTVIDIVLIGSVNVTREVGKRVIKNQNDGCSFLYLSANYARNSAEFLAHSGAAKAGVESIARTLTGEWGKYGMRFNIICPGPIPTQGAFGNLSPKQIEDSINLVSQSVPAGRCGDVQEIANLAAFITSDYGTYISGANIEIDGGRQYLNSSGGVGPYYHQYTDEMWDNAVKVIKKRNK